MARLALVLILLLQLVPGSVCADESVKDPGFVSPDEDPPQDKEPSDDLWDEIPDPGKSKDEENIFGKDQPVAKLPR